MSTPSASKKLTARQKNSCNSLAYLICFIPHRKHGIASYVKQGIKSSTTGRSPPDSAVQWTTFDAMGTHFCNWYKPPPADVDIALLPTMPQNSFVCGDFNNRNTAWGYPNIYKNGKVTFDWLESYIPFRKESSVRQAKNKSIHYWTLSSGFSFTMDYL